MKLAVVGALLQMSGAKTAFAEVGWLGSYVYVWRGAEENVWYDLNAMDQPENFHGANLGAYDPAGEGLFSELWLNSEMNAWADGDDYYINESFRLYYRIYPASEESPATWEEFTESLSITSMGGNNWQANTPGVNIIDGLVPNDYKVDIFAYKIHLWDTDGGGQWEERIWRDGIDNQPFTADFTVVPEPGTLALIGLGLLVLLRSAVPLGKKGQRNGGRLSPDAQGNLWRDPRITDFRPGCVAASAAPSRGPVRDSVCRAWTGA